MYITAMDNRDKIIQAIRIRGPVLPAEISKLVDTNLLFASAMLSELVDKNQLKLSNLKIGGSPLYYANGQEYKLQNFADKLHEKEKKAYDLLRQKRVLRDSEQEPVIRVALRSIKDFAVPLQVNLQESPEIFWKWYLLPDAEAETMIKEALHIFSKEELSKPSEKPSELKIVEQKTLELAKVEEKPEPEHKKTEEEKKEEPKKEPKANRFVDLGDSFYNQIKKFFEKNEIKIIQEELKKKKSELEFVVEVPSNVGSVVFYCRAQDKKLINDKDLAMATIQGQAKKLPVLFLTKGQPTKKAAEMLLKEFKDIKLKKIQNGSPNN